jgi:hypothetical protein
MWDGRFSDVSVINSEPGGSLPIRRRTIYRLWGMALPSQARVALYPDPLVAQVLAAATYPNDIPQAARWADQHHYLNGQSLAAAISADQLPWDVSVQALLPFRLCWT